jgi:hypothetical protein
MRHSQEVELLTFMTLLISAAKFPVVAPENNWRKAAICVLTLGFE